MSVNDILTSIDKEIEQLQKARQLLATLEGKTASASAQSKPTRKRRRLSVEARKKIADAQRQRWAKQKKAANKG